MEYGVIVPICHLLQVRDLPTVQLVLEGMKNIVKKSSVNEVRQKIEECRGDRGLGGIFADETIIKH